MLLYKFNLFNFYSENIYSGFSNKPCYFNLAFTKIGETVFVNGMVFPDETSSITYNNKIPIYLRPSITTMLQYWTLITGTVAVSAGTIYVNTDLSIRIDTPSLSRNKTALVSGFYKIK